MLHRDPGGKQHLGKGVRHGHDIAVADLVGQQAALFFACGVIGSGPGHQEHRPQQTLRIPLNQVEQDISPHRHSAYDSFVDAQMIEQTDHRIGISTHRGRSPDGRAVTEARQVGTEHPEAMVNHHVLLRSPHLAIKGKTVYQHDREAGATIIINH